MKTFQREELTGHTAFFEGGTCDGLPLEASKSQQKWIFHRIMWRGLMKVMLEFACMVVPYPLTKGNEINLKVVHKR